MILTSVVVTLYHGRNGRFDSSTGSGGMNYSKVKPSRADLLMVEISKCTDFFITLNLFV